MADWEVVRTDEYGVVTVARDYRKEEKALSMAQRDKLREVFAKVFEDFVEISWKGV